MESRDELLRQLIITIILIREDRIRQILNIDSLIDQAEKIMERKRRVK